MSGSIAPLGRLSVGSDEARRPVSITQGSSVSWFGRFRDPLTDALVSPSAAVTFDFLAPDETVLAGLEGEEVSTGIYVATITPTDAGLWVARLFADGAQIDERTFDVVASAFPDETEDAVVLVDDDGEYILLDDGTAMEG